MTNTPSSSVYCRPSLLHGLTILSTSSTFASRIFMLPSPYVSLLVRFDTCPSLLFRVSSYSSHRLLLTHRSSRLALFFSLCCSSLCCSLATCESPVLFLVFCLISSLCSSPCAISRSYGVGGIGRSALCHFHRIKQHSTIRASFTQNTHEKTQTTYLSQEKRQTQKTHETTRKLTKPHRNKKNRKKQKITIFPRTNTGQERERPALESSFCKSNSARVTKYFISLVSRELNRDPDLPSCPHRGLVTFCEGLGGEARLP